MSAFIAGAIIVGSVITAGVSMYNANQQKKQAEEQMRQQEAMINQQNQKSEAQIQGQATQSSARAEARARGAYGRSDTILAGAPNSGAVDVLGSSGTMTEDQKKKTSSMLGGA